VSECIVLLCERVSSLCGSVEERETVCVLVFLCMCCVCMHLRVSVLVDIVTMEQSVYVCAHTQAYQMYNDTLYLLSLEIGALARECRGSAQALSIMRHQIALLAHIALLSETPQKLCAHVAPGRRREVMLAHEVPFTAVVLAGAIHTDGGRLLLLQREQLLPGFSSPIL
jgi:hypothetical protein